MFEDFLTSMVPDKFLPGSHTVRGNSGPHVCHGAGGPYLVALTLSQTVVGCSPLSPTLPAKP